MCRHPKARAILLTVIGNLLLTAAILLAFAYFHHVRMDDSTEKRVLATPAPTAVASPQATAAGAEKASAAAGSGDAASSGNGSAAIFTSGDVMYRYSSANVGIEITRRVFEGSICLIADIRLRDISSFKTAVYDQFSGDYMYVPDMANAAGAILALSGDYFHAHRKNGCFAIRNGVVYRDNPNDTQDCCVLYRDGTMACYAAKDTDVAAIEAESPLHVWYFGPLLLDESGHALSEFPHSSVCGNEPRSAVGYYEPGHYAFVIAEGRFDDSPGLTMAQLAQLFESMGCACAYNLDGGQSAAMTFGGRFIHRLCGTNRVVSDILYIVEPDA